MVEQLNAGGSEARAAACKHTLRWGANVWMVVERRQQFLCRDYFALVAGQCVVTGDV